MPNRSASIDIAPAQSTVAKHVTSERIETVQSRDSLRTSQAAQIVPGVEQEPQSSLSRGNSEGGFVCMVCTKRLARKDHLKRHMSTHSPEHPYECLRCAKRFKRDDWRKTHERSCTKTPSLLTTFVPIKNADGAYNCPICEKVLKTSRILKQHIKIHTEPPPLVCDVYGKGFNRTLHLARHSNVHKRDRPFKQRNKASRINLSSSTAETNDLRHLGDLGLDCASKRSVSGKLSDQAGPLLYRPDAGLLDGHFSDIDHCTSFGDSCHPTTSVAHSEEAGGSENECHFPREDNYHFRNALDDVPASETYICLQPNPVTNLAEVCASPTNSDQDQFSILIDPILATL